MARIDWKLIAGAALAAALWISPAGADDTVVSADSAGVAKAKLYAAKIAELANQAPDNARDFEEFCRLMRDSFDVAYVRERVTSEVRMSRSLPNESLALGFTVAWVLYKMDFLKEQREKRDTLGFVLVKTEGTRKERSVEKTTFRVRTAADADDTIVYVDAQGRIKSFGSSQGTVLANAGYDLKPAFGSGNDGGLDMWNHDAAKAASDYINSTLGTSRYAAGCP